MAIECSENIRVVEQDEFHQIDKLVMRQAFNIHNTLGNFCDEQIYKQQLSHKCLGIGIKSKREVEIRISHKDFIKFFYLDLLIDDGCIYEIKVARSLNDIHRQQLINYLFLTGLNHGKLINFRPSSVESEFVSTKITPSSRKEFVIDSNEWNEELVEEKKLRITLNKLLETWGVFLDFRLYNEALILFLGGEEKVIQLVDIIVDNQLAGKQKMQLLNNTTTFHLSGISRSYKGHEKNIRRLLDHTNLTTVQWINFNKNNIKLKTIKK